MPLMTLTELTELQKSEITYLLGRCRQDAPLTLTFPLENSDLYLLYYNENGALLSAAAFTQTSEGEYECSAFTEPGSRKLGLFSSLLSAALELLPEESDILFYSDGTCPDTENVLDALEAELLDIEYFMELPKEACSDPVLKDGILALDSVVCEDDTANGTSTLIYRSSFGQISILLHPGFHYLYDLEIQEPFRGMGHGKALLYFVLTELGKRSPLPVRLQVSKRNLPALNLYKKTGFQITETLSCYLY